jgi:hypothetical protein
MIKYYFSLMGELNKSNIPKNYFSKDFPVISEGISTDILSKIVGAKSSNQPSFLSSTTSPFLI